MNLRSCMKKNVIYISPEMTIKEAADTIIQHHIGTLPVVNQDQKLVGIVTIRDLVAQALPDFVNMLHDIDFVVDFGAAETRVPDNELLNTPVKKIMQPPIAGRGDCSLLRASALFKKHNLIDLPVVDDEERLIGIASLVDIGTKYLQTWR